MKYLFYYKLIYGISYGCLYSYTLLEPMCTYFIWHSDFSDKYIGLSDRKQYACTIVTS